jgi:hypothetical protein
MIGAIPPFSQYAFMAWCSVKAQEQLYLLKGIVEEISKRRSRISFEVSQLESSNVL